MSSPGRPNLCTTLSYPPITPAYWPYSWCLLGHLLTRTLSPITCKHTHTYTLALAHIQGGPSTKLPSFPTFVSQTIKAEGIGALYEGLKAGMVRQIFYATSRFGLFEVFRDQLVAMRGSKEVGATERIVAGLASGATAAVISCPAEVTLVRMSNDLSLPVAERRNYKGVMDAATRIASEEGVAAFWRGAIPFAQRAMLVGVTQVGTLDQAKQFYEENAGLQRGTTLNVFASAMTAGLIYSLITMPFESTKNRMAFQKPDPKTGLLPYRSTVQTITTIAKTEGVLSLWNGFIPYYCRCGGHTTTMFIFVQWLRNLYQPE